MADELLPYYEKELAFIRQLGAEFAEEHPKVATALAYKPSLINDPGYLTKHPELATFFQTHPDIKDAIEENPGNFAAIPPRPGE